MKIYKILIVDDEGILRNGLKHLFAWEDHGFNIIGEAANGEEALAIIEQNQPHIVITDIVMPIMDGVDLVKQISQHYPAIKTIVLSSFSEFKYVREAFKYGASDYLLKPTLRASDLILLLENLCKEINTPLQATVADLSPKMLLNHLLTTQNIAKQPLYEELKTFFPLDSFLLLKASTSKLSEHNSFNKNKLETTLHPLFEHYLKPFKVIDLLLAHEYVVLINLSLNDELLVINKLNKLFATNAEIFEELMFVSTHTFSDQEQIIHMHLILNEALNKSFYFNNKKLVFESEIISTPLKKEFNLNLFLASIKSLDLDTAKTTLFDYCKQVFASQALDEYSFKRFCQNTLYNLINTLQHLGFDVALLNQNKIRIFKSIDTALYTADILNILEQLFDSASQIIAAQADQKNSIILNKVFEKYHFQEKITEDNIIFDYKLYKGRSETRNAIKLLSIIGYSENIVSRAEKRAEDFLDNKVWNEIKEI